MNAAQLEKAITVVIMLSAVIYFRSKKAENPVQNFLGISASRFLILMYAGLAIAVTLLVVSFL